MSSPHTLIDEMGVANVGFLIENLGKDAGSFNTCVNLFRTLSSLFNAPEIAKVVSKSITN
jgi:hypothetical protein